MPAKSSESAVMLLFVIVRQSLKSAILEDVLMFCFKFLPEGAEQVGYARCATCWASLVAGRCSQLITRGRDVASRATPSNASSMDFHIDINGKVEGRLQNS